MGTRKEAMSDEVKKVLELKAKLLYEMRNSHNLMEFLNTALYVDGRMRDLLIEETLLTEKEREVLLEWQSRLNH